MEPRPASGWLPRLGWIYRTALLGVCGNLWVYFVALGYLGMMGLIYMIGLFFSLIFLVFLVELAVIGGESAAAFVGAALWLLFAFGFAGLIATGYNGGMIRMLLPLVRGGRPSINGFIGGVVGLGPRLFLVFCLAVALTFLPLIPFVSYLRDLTSTLGWSVIESEWNPNLQREVIATIVRHVAVVNWTLMTVNALLGPWQVWVGTRRVNFIAALPLSLGFLLRHLPVAIPVIAVTVAVPAGLEWLLLQDLGLGAELQYYLVLGLQLLLSPIVWLSLIALVEPSIPVESIPAEAPPRRAPATAPRPQPIPPEQWRNPAPGLLPPPPTSGG